MKSITMETVGTAIGVGTVIKPFPEILCLEKEDIKEMCRIPISI